MQSTLAQPSKFARFRYLVSDNIKKIEQSFYQILVFEVALYVWEIREKLI